MAELVYYAPVLAALISLGSLCVSTAAWYSIRQRATRNEMLAMERRLATLETAREAAPDWNALEELRREIRDLHGHIEHIAGEMSGISRNTSLILEQLLHDRRSAGVKV